MSSLRPLGRLLVHRPQTSLPLTQVTQTGGSTHPAHASAPCSNSGPHPPAPGPPLHIQHEPPSLSTYSACNCAGISSFAFALYFSAIVAAFLLVLVLGLPRGQECYRCPDRAFSLGHGSRLTHHLNVTQKGTQKWTVHFAITPLLLAACDCAPHYKVDTDPLL